MNKEIVKRSAEVVVLQQQWLDACAQYSPDLPVAEQEQIGQAMEQAHAALFDALISLANAVAFEIGKQD